MEAIANAIELYGDARVSDSDKNALAQVGVKGMKWGVRKRRDSGGSGGAATDVTIKSRPGKIEVSGGHNQMPSDDAKRAAAYRQKARASSVHSLSNQELQALVTRMNLEAQYAKVVAANKKPKGKVHQILEGFVKSELDSALKGKKGNVQPIVEMIIKQQKGKAARKATSKAAGTAGKALAGVVVNR